MRRGPAELTAPQLNAFPTGATTVWRSVSKRTVRTVTTAWYATADDLQPDTISTF
jgi:hypothetical protein